MRRRRRDGRAKQELGRNNSSRCSSAQRSAPAAASALDQTNRSASASPPLTPLLTQNLTKPSKLNDRHLYNLEHPNDRTSSSMDYVMLQKAKAIDNLESKKAQSAAPHRGKGSLSMEQMMFWPRLSPRSIERGIGARKASGIPTRFGRRLLRHAHCARTSCCARSGPPHRRDWRCLTGVFEGGEIAEHQPHQRRRLARRREQLPACAVAWPWRWPLVSSTSGTHSCTSSRSLERCL